MAQCFPDGDAADLKFGGNGILAKLFSFAQFAAKNFLSQPLNNCGPETLPWDG